MKPNKIVLIIISAVLCLALIFGGVVVLSGRNKKKNEKTDGQEKIESTISAEVPKPDMSAESSKTEITDTGKGLKPDETEADKILQKAEQKICPRRRPRNGYFLGRGKQNYLPHGRGAYHRENLRRVLRDKTQRVGAAAV